MPINAPTPTDVIRRPRVGTAVEHGRREHRHEHGVRHPDQADDRHVDQQLANGRETVDVSESALELLQHARAAAHDRARRNVHREQRRDYGNVGDRVDHEAPPLADDGDDDAGDRRPDDARGVEHRRVERDGIREIGAVGDHLDHERLSRRRVERVDHPLHHLQPDDLGHGDCVHQRQDREHERLHGGEDLRDDQDAMPVPPVDVHARERREDEQRNLSRETGDAEEQLRLRQPVDQPTRRDARQPRADQRHALAREEEPVIAVVQCAGDA